MTTERKVVPIGERPRPKKRPANDSPPPPWLILNGNGQPTKSVGNATSVLLHDPAWSGVLAYDERRGGPCFLTPPPWQSEGIDAEAAIPRGLRDGDDVRASRWIEQHHGFAVSTKTAHEALNAAADSHRFDDVRSYLDGLRWDNKPRIDRWLIERVGAADTPYVRAVSSRWLVSAVARVREPGCQADCVLILEGDQGIRKSSLFAALCPDPTWFTDRVSEIGSKDSAQDLQGVWIVELAELDALARAEVSAVKAFVSRRDDRYRASYGRRTENHPRRLVFAGTVNPTGRYLRDETGGRRWWPVRCGASRIDVDALIEQRDQLWAEADHWYHASESWWLDSEALEAAARAEQDARYESDAWEPRIAEWLAIQTAGWLRADTILEGALKLDPGKQGRSEQTRLGRAMARISGWRHAQRSFDGCRAWGYERCQ